MSEPRMKMATGPKAVESEKTTGPELPKRYSVGAILFYVPEDSQVRSSILHAVGTIADLANAASFHQWNGLPMAGVLGIELQYSHGFLDGLAVTGAAVELGKGREDDPDRLEALQAMMDGLSPSIVKLLVDAVKEEGMRRKSDQEDAKETDA